MWSIRVWYGLLGLWALSMARGVVLVALGHADPGESFGYATVTAWKLLATGWVLGICWTGGRSVVAFQALVVGWSAWLMADRLWAVDLVESPWVISTAVTFVLWILPVVVLRPDRRQLLRLRAEPSATLLPLALAAAVPLVIYAVRQGDLADSPTDPEPIIYVMSGLGLVLATQAVLAALRPAGSRWLPRLVAITAAWAGLAAIIWPHDIGSFGTAWGIVLVIWAFLFATAAEVEGRRGRAAAH